jgi:hypothetical protein
MHVGAIFICKVLEEKDGGMRFVVSHPFHDETVERVGQPALRVRHLPISLSSEEVNELSDLSAALEEESLCRVDGEVTRLQVL